MDKKGYKDLIKQKNFMAYVFANVINRFGDSLDSIAFTWIIYAITGNAFWSALIFGINRLPTILLQPFLGVLVDKMSKKKVLIISDVIRGFCVLFIGIGLVQGWLNEWHLLITTIIISTAEAFRMPASVAILPNLLSSTDYEYGVSLNQGLLGTVEMIGLASAGFFIGFFGVESAVFIDMITFFLCALILLFVKTKQNIKDNVVPKSGFFEDFIEGLKLIKDNRKICYILFLAVFMNGIFTPFNALQAPLVKEILHSNEFMLSIIGISFALGGIIGSFSYPKIKDRVTEFQLIRLGTFPLIFIYVGPLFVGWFVQDELLIYILILIIGSLSGILIALLNTYVGLTTVQIVKPEYLGRVNSILYAVAVAAMPVASFIVSWAVAFISTETVFIGCACISTILFFTICSRSVYRNMVESHDGGIYKQ